MVIGLDLAHDAFEPGDSLGGEVWVEAIAVVEDVFAGDSFYSLGCCDLIVIDEIWSVFGRDCFDAGVGDPVEPDEVSFGVSDFEGVGVAIEDSGIGECTQELASGEVRAFGRCDLRLGFGEDLGEGVIGLVDLERGLADIAHGPENACHDGTVLGGILLANDGCLG